jgi:acetylornithine/succinyldiaminopimelate/putrescine aminotransferase
MYILGEAPGAGVVAVSAVVSSVLGVFPSGEHGSTFGGNPPAPAVALEVVATRLMARGVLVKDTHRSTTRIAPHLVISNEDLNWGLDHLRAALAA